MTVIIQNEWPYIKRMSVLTFIGCLTASTAVRRDVSLINDGFPNLFSMYLNEYSATNLRLWREHKTPQF